MKEGNYTGEYKNDWNIVEITRLSNGSYEWKNKANIKWTLFPISGQCCTLKVGTDCPYYYYPYNYTTARSIVIGIYGPFNELYRYQGKITSQTK